MCGIMVMGLLYRLNLWSNVCVCVGFGFNDFVTKSQSFPMDSHYRTDIISGVGHLRSDSFVLLMLYMVAMYNGWGTGIVLQVPLDSVNSTNNG
jgi:hypothetical protein